MFLLIMLCLIGLPASAAGAIRVACLGDSDTYGYGLPDRENNCYPAQLERILKNVDSRLETRNFGVNGATVLQQGDIPYDELDAYRQALAYEPDVVVFHFGGNAARPPNRGFIAEHYVADYNALIDSFAILPNKPKIVICQTKGVFTWAFNNARTVVVEQLVPLIPEIAYARGLPLIDFYSVFSESPELYQSDGIHLNIEGTRLMAEMVAEAILGIRILPDFNGDGVVDFADMCIMVDHRHTDNPLYDIGPPPFGDGIVDFRDLAVLSEYWLNDYRLVAHWKLDETEGGIANDSVGENDGTLYGEPLWQPVGGEIDGALQFDGIDEYVIASFPLGPMDLSLSVFAWIKGGAPGEVIISQTDGTMPGATWLGTDPADGRLMTKLMDPFFPALESDSVITDGQWHHVGLVYDFDGFHRRLYVDGAEVAKDTDVVAGLLSDSELYFGAGKDLDTATFFSGLIDDIRINNVALSAKEIEELTR
jgi:lysophospholipase L1-like esterase